MTRDWSPSQWLDIFDDMLDSELDNEDQWTLTFNYSQTDHVSPEERRRGWRVYSHCVFGRFRCSSCSRKWNSARVVVLFRYRLLSREGRGTVIMRPFGQACRRCPDDDGFDLPGFVDDAVENALRHLFGKIRKNCYGEEDDDDEDDDDDDGGSVCSEKVRTKPHQKDLCEACRAGICCQDN